jgi:hypothetical protein
MKQDWEAIWKHVTDSRGDLLAKGLIQNGWYAYYYNPDVNHPNDDGPLGSKEYKDASEHTFSFEKAKKDKTYYEIPIEGNIINYYPTTISKNPGFRQVINFIRMPSTVTPKQTVSSKITSSPFGFVLARGGKHTALFLKGKIFELHWDVGPWRPSTHSLFDISDFVGHWPWNSGILLFPTKAF